MKLSEYVKQIKANASTAEGAEKAAKVRRLLVGGGRAIGALGIIGGFTCFVLFATAGFAAFGPNGFTARVIVPFVLFVPMFFVAGLGFSLARLGQTIVVGGEITPTAQSSPTKATAYNTTTKNCPYCGNKLHPDDKACEKCGAPIE
ncbi:MAG: zinc ribbon domain-containing protein [Clostridiales bacterium]|jgi:hypothetical protein|nr:zinc ribbon domain-containing protein [Clostridiales bacterium]